ncbi:hypothetical protein LTR10_015222 [Elasticomyces elasticus]|uniref:Ribosomal RNA-processing protein 43 n=1 Tax=Exophiala sideris TaxID=1016849 RepID=A0ABR0JE61_9EURO|nr:hypothetical protein LTR10_015222 [Elasticomyces elasticus]KAK5032697.1 hypothetical protein LTS07_004107 [Exophiala sideris]KAK5037123.1 hypothetical protein LTR13_004928 [Exophiala sideris]KAK5062221.1 hypothetical protein LTR69_004579 [Exophiala sideris]KAK5182281.1 hypothetical protein LTR44_005292 [Eurotiomycetes sp. CCFEE 6388]
MDPHSSKLEQPQLIIKTSSSYNPTAPVLRDDRYQDDEGKDENDAIPLYHLVVPNIELATGCSPKHPANTAPSVEAQSISQRLLSLLHTSQLVRSSDLEIIYTPPAETQDTELGIDGDPQLKAYWTLYIDMMCISYGGSILDAAWLALYAALKDTLLPKAWWDADLEQVLCSTEASDAHKLRLRGMPVPSSFGVFVPEQRLTRGGAEENQYWVLMDMDGFEEDSCIETGAITVDGGGADGSLSLLRIEKSGGSVLGAQNMGEIASFAERRWYQWKDVLDNALMAS